MLEVKLLREELILRTAALEETLASPVHSRLLARMTHVIDDNAAAQLLDSLPENAATRRLAMPAGGSHLDATGTSDSELTSNDVWRGLTRKHFGFPLLTSSYNTMESGLGSSETCLACGGCFDPWGNHALFCDGGTWGIVHTFLKHAVKDFVLAVAAGSGGCVSNVVLEASGQLASTDYRPGDVAGRVNGLQFAIDVFVTRVSSASNRGKSVDKVIEEADAVKRGHYAKLCKDSDVLFFTFGMDAEGRLGERAEDTIRYFTNRLTGDEVKRGIFRRYWTRRIVVGVLSQQMRLVLIRQKKRSPRHSQVADLIFRIYGGIPAMPGSRVVGSNRCTRRIKSMEGLSQQISASVFLE